MQSKADKWESLFPNHTESGWVFWFIALICLIVIGCVAIYVNFRANTEAGFTAIGIFFAAFSLWLSREPKPDPNNALVDKLEEIRKQIP